MSYKISCTEPVLTGAITLPGSKSISNRVLIIEALLGEKIKKQNLSTAADTTELVEALKLEGNAVQAGEGGTSFRFLASLLALQPGDWLLKSSGSMSKRPVGELVEALQKLGAKIEYAGKVGFPPLKIQGGKLKSGKLSIRSDISSQFISSLLLVAPYMPRGLELNIQKERVSSSYIEMTIALMKHFGITIERNKNKLIVPKGNYINRPINIEGDWSAATYYYQLASLCQQGEIELKGLNHESLQGDSVVANMFQSMNVVTTYKKGLVQLTKLSEQQLSLFDGGFDSRKLTFNLSSTPDLFPALAVLCAAKGWETTFSGVAHLQHKESNRLKVFQQELKKMGVIVKEQNGDYLLKGKFKPGKYTIETHKDHRVAMAFAPLALALGSIKIENPEVINKSYPSFWDDLKLLGFKVENAR